ncbi:MAG: DNA polymerase IV [Tuberibacillus sp.]
MTESKKTRIIFHIDMNSFYASVEMRHHPELRGKPLAIAGRAEERRGIIVTASYEARAKGIKATMPVWQAKRLCPELIVKTPHFDLYGKASSQLFHLLREFTPLVQKVSIDEGYMDVTDLQTRYHPVKLAEIIQKRVKQELDLPSSIGIAPNKFLAKMASDMKKPMGMTILRKRDLAKKLWPLPIEDMHGVGKKTAEKLRALQIYTIGDLAHFNKNQIAAELGIQGEKLHERANGIDERPVDPEAEATYKSISQSTTLPEDIVSQNEAKAVFTRLAEGIEKKLKEKKYVAYQIAITIRYFDWQTTNRAKSFKKAVSLKEEILEIALHLFADHWDGRPVRLLGLSAHSLEDAVKATKQLDLFTYEKDAKEEPLIEVIQKLEDKFGDHIVQRGVSRQDMQSKHHKP